MNLRKTLGFSWRETGPSPGNGPPLPTVYDEYMASQGRKAPAGEGELPYTRVTIWKPAKKRYR